MKRFANQKILVTGAAGGIGQAVVAALRCQGATVAAADIAIDKVDADVYLPGDLTDKVYCESLCHKAYDALGGLDILINNAGIIARGKLTEASDDDLHRSLAVNVEAPFRLCRAVIPLMAAAGGGVLGRTSWS